MKWLGCPTAAIIDELIFLNSQSPCFAQEQTVPLFDKNVFAQAISPLKSKQFFKVCP